MKLKFKSLVIVVICIKLVNSKSINRATYCPNGYKRISNSNICLFITPKASPHENLCLNVGQSETDHYMDFVNGVNTLVILEHLKLHGMKSVWLPIRKNTYNFLEWKLPMPNWNLFLEINGTNAPKYYDNGNCVLYLVDQNHWVMDTCGSVHHHLCIYESDYYSEQKYALTHVCNDEEPSFTSSLSKFHSLCFTITMIENLNSTVKNEKSVVFIGTDDKLETVNDFIRNAKYASVLMLEQEWINFYAEKILISTNFSTQVPKGYVPVLENGVVNYADKDVVYYQIIEENVIAKIQLATIIIDLIYDFDSNNIVVNIRNYRYLWITDITSLSPVICHIDAERKNASDLFINGTIIGQNYHALMKLPRDKGVSDYWCEGQMVSTFETIISNRLTLLRNINVTTTSILCVYFEKNCSSANCNFYNELETITMALFPNPDVRILNQEVQLKKVVSIQQSITTFLVHVFRPLSQTININYYKDQLQSDSRFKTYHLTELRFSDQCLSQDLAYFSHAKLNEESIFKRFCLLDSGLPPIQKCIGNMIDGAYWNRVYNIDSILKNCNTGLVSAQSEDLFKLNREIEQLRDPYLDSQKAKSIFERTVAGINRSITMENTKLAEVHFAAITLNNLFQNQNIFKITGQATTKTTIDPIVDMIDILIERETHPFVADPNKILQTIDSVTAKYAESRPSAQLGEADDGVTLIQKKNIIIMFVNPEIKNITGIALYKNKKAQKEVHDLQDFSVRKLFGHERATDIFNKSLELAAQIPIEIFRELHIDRHGQMMPPKQITFKIYYKNSLFDETAIDPDSGSVLETVDTDSKIISISVSGYHRLEVPHGIFSMFKTNFHLRRSKPLYRGCSDFSEAAETKTRQWNRRFTKFDDLGENVILCPVKRLSNIGFVKLFGNKIVTDKTTKILIDISHYSTLVGCILSLFGLSMIFLTAIFYEKWKLREATPLVLNLSVATFLQITTFAIAESQIFTNSIYCMIVGGVLHYFTLVSVFITLFVAHCQYRRYIIIFGMAITEYFKVKIVLFGWLAPLIIVCGCIIFEPTSYVPSEEFHDLGGICYPTGIVLQCFVHFPIVAICCFNFGLYIWIMVRLTRENPSLRKTPRKSIVVAQVRLFVFLFMVLSLPWIFGLMAHYTELYIFSFMFNLLAPMQGFCLFVFCCLIDSQTRNFWLKLKMCKKP